MIIKYSWWILAAIATLAISIIFAKMQGKEGTWTTYKQWYSSINGEENYSDVQNYNKAQSVGEQICRKCLQSLFPGYEFKNSRLKGQIINPNTSQPLELDCYNEELKIAIEYHGIAHYKFQKFFHRNDPKNFVKMQERDEWKKQSCFKLGILLIIVPYNLEKEKICDFIKRELKKYGKLDFLYGWKDNKED